MAISFGSEKASARLAEWMRGVTTRSADRSLVVRVSMRLGVTTSGMSTFRRGAEPDREAGWRRALGPMNLQKPADGNTAIHRRQPCGELTTSGPGRYDQPAMSTETPRIR